MVFDSENYIHDSDRAALNALKAIPGFASVTKICMKYLTERNFMIQNMSGKIRLSEKQLPEFYDLLPPICAKLGIDVPELYLELGDSPRSYTYGDTKPFIVLTAELLDALPAELVPTVIARECGHIACNHSKYRAMGELIFSQVFDYISGNLIGKLITVPLISAFQYWMRCSEYSADRAAILCDGSADHVVDMCMRLAGYRRGFSFSLDREEFLAQGREYREMVRDSAYNKVNEFLVMQNTEHPHVVVRAVEAVEWVETDQFRSNMNGSARVRKFLLSCPVCGGPLQKDDEFCGLCGSPIERDRLCPSCAAVYEEGQPFCGKCGAALPVQSFSAKSGPALPGQSSSGKGKAAPSKQSSSGKGKAVSSKQSSSGKGKAASSRQSSSGKDKAASSGQSSSGKSEEISSVQSSGVKDEETPSVQPFSGKSRLIVSGKSSAGKNGADPSAQPSAEKNEAAPSGTLKLPGKNG